MHENKDPIAPERDIAPMWRSRGGKLILMRCEDCDRTYYYPRPRCPFCLGDNVSWMECSGRGEIYSYSVLRRGDALPIGFVRLEEGPTMMTNFVDVDVDTLAIGRAVQVVFRAIDGIDTPMFVFAD